MLNTGDEFACIAHDITLRQARIMARRPANPRDVVICYLDNIGIVRGIVTRVVPGGFLIDFEVTDERRARIAARLEWHVNRASELAEQRAAPRIVPVNRSVEVSLGGDMVFKGTIIDISLTGTAITLDRRVKPFPGSVIRVGKRYATVVRHLENGVAVEFKLPFTSETFNEHVVL